MVGVMGSRHAVVPIGDNPRPFLMEAAVCYFDHILSDYDGEAIVFEWGSGHSTPWLAERAERVTSVEHRIDWAEEVTRALSERNLEGRVMRVDLADYMDAIDCYPDKTFDVVYVDGHQPTRVACIKKALDKVTDGGWLVIDDSHWQQFDEALDALDKDKTWDCVVIVGRKIGRVAATRFYRKGLPCSS